MTATAWLLDSDPSIRWQTLRDLDDAPADVLRGLDYFRSTGEPPDARADEALALVRSKEQPDGTWLLENTHKGAVHFSMEAGDGQPSRWNTLRALRVLRWADSAGSP